MLNKISTSVTVIEDGAAEKLMAYLKAEWPHAIPFIICDVNTEKYAAKYFPAMLRYVYPDRQHATPEASLLAVPAIREHGVGMLIACGSGSIHDITRYLAAELSLPLISFPTAASVDGFASSMAAMTINGQKLTVPSHAPCALFAEPDVFCDAPEVLTLSGIGDLVGKYTSLFDWKVGHLLTGEPYDATIEAMERDALNSLFALEYGSRDFTIQLMEGLVISGLAIQQFGNTRPASGSEHHLSHFWEMHCANEPTDALHGEQVGVASIILLEKYRHLTSLTLTKKPLTKEYLAPIYGSLTDGIIKENLPFLPDTITQEVWDRSWDEIRRLAETELPSPAWVADFLATKGGKTTLADLGLPNTEEFLATTLTYAPYVRNRLTLLKLL